MLELIKRSDLLQQTTIWQQQQKRVALVPTMGNLHAGHLSLIDTAHQHADVVVASIFVNPTQFGEGEDFASYPRTLNKDREQLTATGCDALFLPTPDVLYPYGSQDFTRIQAPFSLTNTLCGLSRPGHFDGVLSVVSRLFNLISPQVAVFGEKDYQQLLIIKRMVEDLGMPQQVIAGPTVRETSGLAMSSRNQYLDSATQQQAAQLQQTLQAVAQQLDQGQFDLQKLEAEACKRLEQAGFQPEYVSIRQADDLSSVDSNSLPSQQLRILAAARLESTRLIDNVAWPALNSGLDFKA